MKVDRFRKMLYFKKHFLNTQNIVKLKYFGLLILLLVGIQGIIIITLHLIHKDVFSQYAATEQPMALKKLCEIRPWAGWTIRACWLLCGLEVVALIIVKKYYFYQ